MKKILIVLALCLAVLSSAFAAEDYVNLETDSAYKSLLKPFEKTSARMLAMGGAGVAGFSNQDALYVNPASLGNKGFVFNTPSVAFTLYNFQDLNKTGLVDSLVSDASSFSDPKNIAGMASKLLPIYTGKIDNAILGIDAGVGAKLGRFAFALDVQSKVLSHNPGSTTDITLIPMIDAVASVGLGFRFFRNSAVNFDIGAAVRMDIRAYFDGFSANSLLNGGQNGEEGEGDVQSMYVGVALPVDIGVNLNLPVGFSIGAVLRNINGQFKVTSDVSITDIAESGSEMFRESDFSFNTPMLLNVGFGWHPDLGGVSNFINPSIAVDFVDLISVFSDFSSEKFLGSIRAGIEVEVLRMLELRAGINQGYYSVGAGFNLFNVIHVEASYYRQELGNTLGDCPVDALTVRFNILWER